MQQVLSTPSSDEFSFIHCLFGLMCFVVVIMLQPGNTSPEAVFPALALFHVILTALNFRENLCTDLQHISHL
jgi:hypothetical protein